jgi:hypothetical protein
MSDPDVRTAQDVIDAMRFVLMSQKDPAEAMRIVDCLVDLAPDTENDRGITLLVDLLAEGSLKVALI